MANTKEIIVPDLGGIDSVAVTEILVAVGDTINVEDSLITVESDKASMEIPAPAAGTVTEIKINVGDSVAEGDLILTIDADANETGEAAQANQNSADSSANTATAEVAATSETSAAAGNSVLEVAVPDIGDSGEVEVIEVLVATGDSINAEDPIITLESDKASMEVPAPAAGTVKSVHVNVGDKVTQGHLILVLEAQAEAAPAAAPAPTAVSAPAAAPAPAAALANNKANSPDGQRPAPLPTIDERSFNKAHASPAVRRFARELGADLANVSGTGPKGRILKEDVQQYIKQILTAGGVGAAAAGGGNASVADLPDIDFSTFGEIETQALSKINKLTGKFLHRSWFYVPHVTQFDEADITELEAFRKQLSAEYKDKGIKITIIAFLIKAVIAALKEFPRFNASLDNSGENLILKKYFHIGVAVDTPDGLVVPVIRDADKKSLVELAQEVVELAVKARDKKLKPADMQGACFTISSLGGVGGTAFTPIVNQPEVAILGVSRSAMKPVYDNGEFLPRLILPLSLSYDHRVIDGVAAARFTTYLSKVLSDIRRLLL